MPAIKTQSPREVPAETIHWLLEPENPAVAVLTRRLLLGKPDDPATTRLWARRNDYSPIAAILGAESPDGSWMVPSQDYKKYQGSLWQIHLLGELWTSDDDPRIRKAADYAFSRQLPDGSWSATNMRVDGSIACLTSNVARALARMGWARDERVISALAGLVALYRELGIVDCREGRDYQLNGYCHMLTVKELLFLGEVPRELWPDGASELKNECVALLKDKQVIRSLPEETREFNDAIWTMPAAERPGFRKRYLAEHPELHYKDKAGWKRFGFPLSYNSDALEALWALIRVGEPPSVEYRPAIELVRGAADREMRWSLKNTFNGKMLADVEAKGLPSKWLTLRALQVLAWAST